VIEYLMWHDPAALPFLAGALERHLEQFPSVENGLARTERQIIELVEQAVRDFPSLFRAGQKREERIFMGKAAFRHYVKGLSNCRYPLLEQAGDTFALTRTGRDVRAARTDHIHLNDINRWLGGVHLDGFEALWRWDGRARRLVPH